MTSHALGGLAGRNPTPLIDAYLLEEQSCYISSRYDLKRQSLRLFEELHPNNNNNNKMIWDQFDLKISGIFGAVLVLSSISIQTVFEYSNEFKANPANKPERYE